MKKSDPFSEAMTPMIDLAFNLLLFFVISIVIVPEDVVPLKLPSNFNESQSTIEVTDHMTFQVLRSGAVLVQGKILVDSLAPDSVLYARADTLIAQYKSVEEKGKIILRADSGAVWDRPIQILQASGKHAVPLSIALEPQKNIAVAP